MTNKPMLSVERELLERLRVPADVWVEWTGDAGQDFTDALGELRSILDRKETEEKPIGWVCEKSGVLGKDAVFRESSIKPAAQHQGEPVALQHIAVSEGGVLRWMTGRKMQHCELYAMPDGSAIRSKLYAEQPAPVAVVMPEPYGLAMFKMLSGFDSVTPEQFNLVWTACRKEVARLNGVTK